jgi:non-homologous end joining protein Ku
VHGLLDEEVKGREITAAAEAPCNLAAGVVDLVEALKRSISAGSRAPATKAAVAKKVRKSRRVG